MICRNYNPLVGTLAIAAVLFAADVDTQPAVPRRQLSPASAVTNERLGLLLGARVLNDGRLIVNDAANRRLLMFDATLARATIIGDSGGATGLKYGTTASPIIAYLADSTFFLDRASQSLVVLDGQGRQARVAALPKPADAVFIGGSRTLVDAAGRLLYRGTPRGQPMRDTGQAVVVNKLADSAPVVRADFDTRRVDTLGRVKLPSLQENHRHRQSDGTWKVRVVLFGLSWIDDWTMTSDGTIAIVRGQDYHIDWITSDGRLTSTPKMPFAWRSIDEVEQRRLADSAARETQAFIDRTRANPPAPRPDGTRPIHVAVRIDIGTGGVQIMPIDAVAEGAPLDRIPDYHPPIRAGNVLADRNGNVWVLPAAAMQTPGAGIVYDVVNRKGEIIERVELPAGRSILEFGTGDTVYTMHKDSAEVWRVERRRIVR